MHGSVEQNNLKVLAIVGMGGLGKTTLARRAWQSVVSSFDCKAWICVSDSSSDFMFFREVLEALASPSDQFDLDGKEEELMAQLQLHLKGKRFLLVFDDIWERSLWNRIKSAFPHENCSAGSAILITTRSIDVAHSFSPNENLDLDTDSYFYLCNAMALMNSNDQSTYLRPLLREIVSKPLPIRLFLRALYVNPNKTKGDLQNLCDSLDSSKTSITNNVRQLLTFCNLSSNCKNCLLYMSIFPEDTIFERTRLVRRWAVEGMTTKRGRLSALHEADHCFDLLVAHGLLIPMDMAVTGKVKSCKMHQIIHDIVTEIATDDNFVKSSHQPDLAHRLSIHYEVQPQQAEKEQYATCSIACWDICRHSSPSDKTTVEQSNATATQEFLESLPSSTHLGVLKVLDLENCNELKDHHLKNICNHVFHLKYLSLRKTGITQLPKQLDKLQFLETLDIRETEVKAFAKNSLFLPKLKHLLAGQWTDDTTQGSVQSKETFLTVSLPKRIGNMTELQVLSHIAVSGKGDEIIDVGNLLQLVKLGVVLSGSKRSVFWHLYHAIGKLRKCLRSLSIRVTELTSNEEDDNMNIEEAPLIHPKYLQKLKISGLKYGLPSWIKKLDVLTKITLHMTFITDDDFKILGELKSLSCLRLQRESCNESTLTFKKDAFQSLKFLDIECSAITSIKFVKEASPMLKKLVWSSTREQSLSGIEDLPSFRELKLTGIFDLQSVEQAIAANKNKPILVADRINA
ncbi:unnamed protein product [Triticum aestivum]|uniref:Uncharacterized protein n=1 Tax=Triticum aestivum TaxID=4565 RepID=A0A7H4LRG4_WHEAT|nr:unnamed protein product [Triticum aestivum]